MSDETEYKLGEPPLLLERERMSALPLNETRKITICSKCDKQRLVWRFSRLCGECQGVVDEDEVNQWYSGRLTELKGGELA